MSSRQKMVKPLPTLQASQKSVRPVSQPQQQCNSQFLKQFSGKINIVTRESGLRGVLLKTIKLPINKASNAPPAEQHIVYESSVTEAIQPICQCFRGRSEALSVELGKENVGAIGNESEKRNTIIKSYRNNVNVANRESKTEPIEKQPKLRKLSEKTDNKQVQVISPFELPPLRGRIVKNKGKMLKNNQIKEKANLTNVDNVNKLR